jgi:hypothetical protein
MRAIAVAALTVQAIAALSSLPACGGSDTSSICGATADSGALTVNAPEYTCGSAAFAASNDYIFTAAAAAQHTVALVSTSGNANLCTPEVQVSPPPSSGGSFICPLNDGTQYDVLVFTAEAGTTYQVSVVGALVGTSKPTSTYGIHVTSP